MRLSVPVDPRRDHIQGPPHAPLTLVEYGDYECPYCAMAYPVVKAVQREMGRELRFVFRHFPLTSVHPHAQAAAEAAEAAGAQGRFWEIHGMLYRHQDMLGSPPLLASRLDLDMARFMNELMNRVHAARVREDFVSGVRSGVNGTPAFFINGIRHDGSWDVETLVSALEGTPEVAALGRYR
ncbi:MAG TPA: DsbA family protein [Candidatus Polarisedimenticolia bacterium]|nr:DsbA family protein [Candidatus Polarisedimenticolia bacterium]